MKLLSARIVSQVVSAGRVQVMLPVIGALRQNPGMTQFINRNDLLEKRQFLADSLKMAAAPHSPETRDVELLVKRLFLKMLAGE